MQCHRCQQENPREANFCLNCATPLKRARPADPDLNDEVDGLRRALSEALEQQTATSEILRVISNSPTDVRPVFDAIAETAARLCESFDAAIYRPDGDRLVLVAHHGAIPLGPIGDFSIPFVRGTVAGQSMLSGQTVHVADVQTEGDEFPQSSQSARQLGFRTILCVPLMREGVAIGSFSLRRTEVQLFTDRQVALLETFADQAVIAIENVRLFKELEARNADLTEALEQQTATAEVLRVIGSSPTDAQPVFEAIVRSARRLLSGFGGAVYRVAGDELHLAAYISTNPYGDAALRSSFPRPLVVFSPPGEAIRRRAPVVLTDIETDGWIPDDIRELIRKRGDRSGVWVPMMREGVALGAIGVTRIEPASFGDEQIALLRTFADQAVIAIENVRLFKELEARNSDLTEALGQQTATAEILRVISRSQTDVQPVFDTIVRSAVRLCDGLFSALYQFDGELIHHVARHNYTPEALEEVRRIFPARPSRALLIGRAILERAVIHTPDVELDPEWQHPALSRAIGFRSGLFVPMLREGTPIGAIVVTRAEPGPFSNNEIELLKTFADQAVIAIENVRLFTELQEKNRALTAAHAEVTETLEQQTAMAEILGVISTSPTHLQPVLDAVVKSAARFCAAPDASIFRFDGENLRADAHHGSVFLPRGFLVPVVRGTVAGRSVLERQAVSVTDLQAETEEFPEGSSLARQTGHRATLSAPLLREGAPIGVILLRRVEAVPFTGKQIALVKTFADQAVIAIENVRLFTELEARNRDLTAALDKQTATSEILRVISGSQTDVQPVFDTIIQSAVRLLSGFSGVITQIVDDQLHLAALTSTNPSGDAAQKALWPKSVKQDGSLHGHVISALVPRAITDVESDRSVPPIEVMVARERGYRSMVAVPLLRDGRAVGSMAVTRREPGPFADGQVALLQTFADQAVIAIENVRLFKELDARTRDLSRSVAELRALSEVGQAISSTLDLQAVLSTIVARATELSGTDAGVVYEYDEQREVFLPRATEHLEAEVVETMLATPVRKGEGATGRLAEVHEPTQLADVLEAPAESRVRSVLVRAGYRALLAVPLVREGRLIGGLTVIRKATGAFAPEVIELLRTFATQSALAIQNARLFREIADKSRQLEAASQHKSEFLANMSHELRTPLNAILGFSEVLAQGMFGGVNEKQAEYLHDILESGRHLLSLINDILDLSKIEAGRMELELSEFGLPQAIQNALTLVRERALRRGIALHHVIDDRVAEIRADERKVKQVLLNLLSNAIKFTPEGGRIDVRAAPADGLIEVSVADSGVGIAPEDQEAVFEEFRQVGTADKKAEGTGLGLALSRKFIELHGGTIRVQSEVGRGATFTFSLPITSAAGMDHRVARD